MKKCILVTILCVSLGLSACTVAEAKNATDLMEGIKKSGLTPIEISDANDQGLNKTEEIADLSLKLLRESFEEENILMSPLSIVSALGMTTNGASSNTLSQMEEVLETNIDGLNKYLQAYTSYLPSSEYSKVHLANSIWFRDKEALTINKNFLQTNKDYYDADIYKAPFDQGTKDDINVWVKDKTKGMIDSLLEEAPPKEAVMYLINALAFDAEWEDVYEESQIYDGEFTQENGEKQDAEMMRSKEGYYLENDRVTGFMKPYKDNKYAFVALLPKENTLISDLLASLDGKALMDLSANKKDETVYVQMPKFGVEYETLLNEPLQALGMVDAFDEKKADFTRLGQSTDGNILISRIIHKTKINVDEKGTQAGAVTAVEMIEESAMIEEPKEVMLDRPFIYMIVDTKHNLPLFIGSLMHISPVASWSN